MLAPTAKPFRVIDNVLSRHFQDPVGALGKVRETLLQKNVAARVVPAALYGMGGVGKTQLALKYSYEVRDRYAGVWWFRAETDNTLQMDASSFCAQVHASIQPGELPAAACKQWLRTQSEPWLLVFDNAESVESLRAHLPDSGPHHVLVTSRNPAWGGVAHPIELESWPDDTGAAFLASRLKAPDSTSLRTLSHSLGGLALALEQAASFLEESGGSVSEYQKLIDGVDTSTLLLDEGRPSTGYERSVMATLSTTFHRLSPAAQELVGICAFFSADP